MIDEPRLFDPALPPVDRNVAPIGHRHPDTAKAAGERALPRTGSKRRQVVEEIVGRWLLRGDGFTAEEIGDRFGWPHQSYSATVSTLARDGWLVDGGSRRTTSTGSDAIVWVPSRDALEVHGR